MRFSPEAERFLGPGTERLVALAGLLAARSVPYSIVRTGKARHLLVRFGRGPLRLVLAAHYDRRASSPGTLDNSCACLQLVELAARLGSGKTASGPGSREAPDLLIVFTDAEEAAAWAGPAGQGSFTLARVLRAALRQGGGLNSATNRPSVLVLDVTGRGDRLLLSSAPALLLERNGMGDSALAGAHRALVASACSAASMAGIAPPRSLPLPWSDDLGLVLGGLPALAASVLPSKEAEAYAAAFTFEREAVGPPYREGGPGIVPVRKELGPAWPPTWDLIHGPEDLPTLAEEGAFALMAAFLDAVASGAASPLASNTEP
jgi:hypothetical protein